MDLQTDSAAGLALDHTEVDDGNCPAAVNATDKDTTANATGNDTAANAPPRSDPSRPSAHHEPNAITIFAPPEPDVLSVSSNASIRKKFNLPKGAIYPVPTQIKSTWMQHRGDDPSLSQSCSLSSNKGHRLLENPHEGKDDSYNNYVAEGKLKRGVPETITTVPDKKLRTTDRPKVSK